MKNIWQKLPLILRCIVIIILCWVLFVSVEGFRLIGSTDPGRFPFLRLGGVQTQDIVARYDSLGFSQIYYLTDGDTFISGEFKVLGFSVKKWENPDFADTEDEEDDALDELAQTLYDLRVETIADPDDPGALTAIRAMLDAMGASELGPYALEYHDITHGLPVTENGMLAEEDGWPKGDGDAPPYRKTALVVRYTEPFAADDKRVNKVHGVMSELLMVLVEDLDRVSFEFTRVNKPGGEFGYGTTRETVDEMAKYLGRDHPAELADSPEGIRTILRYCGDRVYEFLPILDEEEGEYTYQWLDKETATNVGYLHMDFKITAVFPDCFFAKPIKPISGEFKFNGVLPDEWNVGDQVLCVSKNAYFDEQSNRWESDIIRVEESNRN